MTDRIAPTVDPLAWRAPNEPRHPDAMSPPVVTVIGGELPRSTPAEAARTVAARRSDGALSTLTVDGAPFCSVVCYALDDNGSPLFAISELAEHTRNLLRDPRAALLVTEPNAGDPLAAGRVTLLGAARRVAATSELLGPLAAAVPTAGELLDLADFSLWRLDLSGLRWVGGFGEMAWIDVAAYAAATVDPILPHRAEIVAHMNADHAHAGAALCRTALGVAVAEATMRHADRHGFEYVATVDGGVAVVRRNFPHPVATVAGFRRQIVTQVREVTT